MPNDADRAGTAAGVFGAELRYYRTRAGLPKDLAPRGNVSHDVISKIETGERPPAEDFRRGWTRSANWTPGGAGPAMGHLKKSMKQRAMAGSRVGRYRGRGGGPAVLRAADCARAASDRGLCPGGSARPGGDVDDLDAQVAARLARQAVLDRAAHPVLVCAGRGRAAPRHRRGQGHRAQLYRLADLAGHPEVTVQVIPAEGGHAGLLGGFSSPIWTVSRRWLPGDRRRRPGHR